MTQGRISQLLSNVVLRSQSDARLAQLAADGHQLAFTTIFERYETEMRSHAARIVRPGAVDDVVQHAMLNAWSALLAGRNVDQPRAWLHRIVHNVALNTVARCGYADGAIPETTPSPMLTDEIVESRLSAADALAAVAALPDTQRKALLLTALESRSGADAAAELGVSESAMRQLVYRARTGMRSAATAITPFPLVIHALHGSGAAGASSAGVFGASGGLASAGVAGGAGALSGAVVKAAAVIVVAASGVGATAAIVRENHGNAATAHESRSAVTSERTSAAVTSSHFARLDRPAAHIPAGSQRHGATTGSNAGKHGAEGPGNRGEHGATGHSNATNGASHGSTGVEGSDGGTGGPSGSVPANDSTSPRAGVNGPDASQSLQSSAPVIETPVQPNEPGTSNAGGAGTSAAPVS